MPCSPKLARRGRPPDRLVVKTTAVVCDPQEELPFLVIDLHGDPLRLRVPEGVSQRLTGNAARLVAHDRVEAVRIAVHRHPDSRRLAA